MERSERRHRRTRAVKRAFQVYWEAWGDWRDWQHHRWWGYEPAILDGVKEKWAHQDRNRADCRLRAALWADHMRTCSCYVCKGHKWHEKDASTCREDSKTRDDWGELVDYLRGL